MRESFEAAFENRNWILSGTKSICFEEVSPICTMTMHSLPIRRGMNDISQLTTDVYCVQMLLNTWVIHMLYLISIVKFDENSSKKAAAATIAQ